jgi:hypothetical protein
MSQDSPGLAVECVKFPREVSDLRAFAGNRQHLHHRPANIPMNGPRANIGDVGRAKLFGPVTRANFALTRPYAHPETLDEKSPALG